MPSFKIIGLAVLEKMILQVFTIYWQCGHLGLVTQTIYINFRSLFSRRIHIHFGFDWPSGLREALRCLNTVDDGQTTDDGRCQSMGKR